MDQDLIYDIFNTPAGVKIEAVSGGTGLSEKVHRALARQVWQENGPEGYRVIEHFPNGAPRHSEIESRISVSHCAGMFVVASLPRTPEADLAVFNPRTAMGVDCEPLSREQVMNVRDRFLCREEMEIVPHTTEATLLAWTAKEACYKAAMTEGLPFTTAIRIISLPDALTGATGEARIALPEGEQSLSLYAMIYEGFIICIAYSPKCAAFKRKKQ